MGLTTLILSPMSFAEARSQQVQMTFVMNWRHCYLVYLMLGT